MGEIVAGDETLCVECGYDLVGLAVDGDCPECGVAIARSLHERMLRFEPPDWLDSLARGVRTWHRSLTVFAVLPLLLLVFLGVLVAFEAIGSGPVISSGADRIVGSVLAYALLAAALFVGIGYLRGVWLMTTPKADGGSVLGVVRGPARWLTVAFGVAAPVALVMDDFRLPASAVRPLNGVVIALIAGHLWTLGRMGVTLSDLTPGLAPKVRKRLRLAQRDAWIVGILAALGALGGTNILLGILVLYFLSVRGAFGALRDAVRVEARIGREINGGGHADTLPDDT